MLHVNDEMELPGDRIEITVKIAGRKWDGRRLFLREATADQAKSYKDARARAMTVVDGEIKGFDGLHATEILLVHLCLAEGYDKPTEDGGGFGYKPVDIDDVRALPSRTVKALYERVMEISELHEGTLDVLVKQRESMDRRIEALSKGDPAKNGQSGTTTGSASPVTLGSRVP